MVWLTEGPLARFQGMTAKAIVGMPCAARQALSRRSAVPSVPVVLIVGSGIVALYGTRRIGTNRGNGPNVIATQKESCGGGTRSNFRRPQRIRIWDRSLTRRKWPRWACPACNASAQRRFLIRQLHLALSARTPV